MKINDLHYRDLSFVSIEAMQTDSCRDNMSNTHTHTLRGKRLLFSISSSVIYSHTAMPESTCLLKSIIQTFILCLHPRAASNLTMYQHFQ